MTKTIRSLAAFVAAGLLPCVAPAGASSDALAGARAATARYHDIAAAEADGYIAIGFCEPGEGCHYLNPALVDGVFDAEHPEILLYVPRGEGMRLVAVEYVIPLGLSATAPDGFRGDADVWREDTEGAGLWELTAWIWMHNPAGMFEQHNPRLQ
jgi:hypothetical protein